MKISDIMTEKNVVLGLKANSKRQLLQELSDKAAEITALTKEQFLTSSLTRKSGFNGFRRRYGSAARPPSPNSTKFTACLQN